MNSSTVDKDVLRSKPHRVFKRGDRVFCQHYDDYPRMASGGRAGTVKKVGNDGQSRYITVLIDGNSNSGTGFYAFRFEPLLFSELDHIFVYGDG